MQVWDNVKARPGHPRGGNEKGEGGQAGVVVLADDKNEVIVKWDTDGVSEIVPIDQLTRLS